MKNVQCGRRTLALSAAGVTFVLSLTLVWWSNQSDTSFRRYAVNTQHARLSSRNLAHIPALGKAFRTSKTQEELPTEDGSFVIKTHEETRKHERQSGIHQRLPAALIIGAAKCGTEALKKFLSLHPRVVPVKREMCFFNNVTFFGKGVSWYREQMPFTAADQLTLEKSPSYFASRQAAERLRRLIPNVKLIVVVCDPIRRTLSDAHRIYATKLHRRFTAADFESEVIDPRSGRVNEKSKIVQRSLYILHLRKWLSVFNSSRILIIDGEMLAKNPLTELKKTERFLGLPSYLSTEHLYYDEDKGFFCMVRGRQKKCLSKNKGRKHPEITPHVFQALQSFFQPSNELFFNEVGHRFRWL